MTKLQSDSLTYGEITMRAFFLLIISTFFVGCSPSVTEPIAGPDKQGSGMLSGAVMGAGSGAVSGAQLGSVGAGPGALVGAGFGAVFGMFSGIGRDIIEDDQHRRMVEQRELHSRAWAQAVLAEHYAKRLDVHPNRDIYPADLFFEGDSATLRPGADMILDELVVLTKQRMPWSRIVVASYVSTNDLNSSFAQHITEQRAERIALALVRGGMNPQRVLTQAMPITDILVADPYDNPNRYRQAIELIPLDY